MAEIFPILKDNHRIFKYSKLGLDSGLSLATDRITIDLAADHKILVDSELVLDLG